MHVQITVCDNQSMLKISIGMVRFVDKDDSPNPFWLETEWENGLVYWEQQNIKN